MKKFVVALSFTLLAPLCGAQPLDKRIFPDPLYQGVKELQSSSRVLLVALEPGMEDQGLVAYLRASLGASVSVVFVTNGEAREPDDGNLLPQKLAAERKLEGFSAMSTFGADCFFMNVPDPGSVQSVRSLRRIWPSDTLQQKFNRLVNRLRPDVVIICDNPEEPDGPKLATVREDIMAAMKASEGGGGGGQMRRIEMQQWKVRKILLQDPGSKRMQVSLGRKHPLSDMSFAQLGQTLQSSYVSISSHLRLWNRPEVRSFKLLAGSAGKAASFDSEIAVSVTRQVSGLSREIQQWCSTYFSWKKKNSGRSLQGAYLLSAFRLINKVDETIRTWQGFTPEEKALVLQWKNGLENTRNALLGLELRYTISDSILAPRQLSFLTIDTLIGRSQGKTEIYFPAIAEGWIIDEELTNRFPYREKDQYRMLSPETPAFNYPVSEYGLDDMTVGRAFPFLIIHRDSLQPERSFNYRVSTTFFFSPKFTAEVLNPAVRISPGEFTVVRLTNHSRDGVRDTMYVKDSLVFSQKSPFRLPSKESTQTDSLFLTWTKGIEAGTYIFPVLIGGGQVAQFGGRQFSCEMDQRKRVAYFAGADGSPLQRTLRSVGIRAQELKYDGGVNPEFQDLDVVIIDARALVFHPELSRIKDDLHRFASRGGHVIILAQEAQSWNRSPLIDGIFLKYSGSLESSLPISTDSTDQVLMAPNKISRDDWQDWLFKFGTNEVVLGKSVAFRSVVQTKTSQKLYPLLITQKEGNGRFTYAELNFWHQWMNIHPGAYRLLANLISY